MAIPEESPFRRFTVFNDVRGGTRVYWELVKRFDDDRPHEFQLQVAPTSAPAEDEWANVGLPAENVFYLVDDEQRSHGKTHEHHWRIRLTTPQGVYYSETVMAREGLDFREWRLVREMLRQARKRAGKFTGTDVYLLKRKVYGTPCDNCLDPHTDQPTQHDCPVCFGTAVKTGYHRALEGLYADIGLEKFREEQDYQTVGTDKKLIISADLHGFPSLSSRDVVGETRSGRRWFVHTINETSALRGFPFKHSVELRLAPWTDPIYDVSLGGS